MARKILLSVAAAALVVSAGSTAFARGYHGHGHGHHRHHGHGGGKGAAIALGTLLIIAPGIVLAITLVGSVILFLTRYVSLAVLVMFGIATLWMIVLVDQNAMPIEYRSYSLLVAALILYRFRENIERLLRGTERRLGERA